jgi:methionine synthase I (cobalamin-dependent)
MHPTLEKIMRKGAVLTDGAWGTQLQMRGLASGDCPDIWNLTQSARVAEVAASYVQAGSQIILTNTFGANRIRLAGFNLQDQTAAINKAGVEISSKAAGGWALVFASIGPSGKMLMMGDVTEAELRSAFEEQAQALASGGADGLVVETMSDLAEARIAVAAAKTTGLPVVACMVFDSGKNKYRTMMGSTPEQVAQELDSAGADVIGANCGQGIESFLQVCQRLHASASKPIWIKANAGLPVIVDGKTVYKTTASDFAGYVPGLRQAGAAFIGGCCGTSPEFIAASKVRLT